MSGQPQRTEIAQLVSESTPSRSVVPTVTTWIVWTLFLCSVGTLLLSLRTGIDLRVPGWIAVDGLTTVMWVVVAFFSGVVHSYSRRYMAGERDVERFYGLIFAFTVAVGVLVAADHVALFVAAWLAMGLAMASLVGYVRGWPQAQAAASVARRYFLASSGLLAVALTLLAMATGATTISGLLENVGSVSPWVGAVAIGCLVLAAMVQSALLPFHGWLLSSMTAPTPASALMHAGFVNAGGVLLTRFAPLFAEELTVMSLLVAIGAVSAVAGQALGLVQPTVKRKLGASTLAQMGFMILQCGLGFFAAAVAHLILHGFYKAYLFLSAGASVEHTAPKESSTTRLGGLGLVASLLAGLGGGVLFALLTGKGLALDSGLVLTAVVALTTLHAARDLLGRTGPSPAVRLVALPLVVAAAIGLYAGLFNAVSAIMADVPMVEAATELTVVHLTALGLFAVAYLAFDRGWHRASERLYVTLLNASEPVPATVLTQTEEYNDA